MSQTFTVIPSTEAIATSRTSINNNLDAIKTCFSGTAFPTTNLVVGMFCYRTDTTTLYQLQSTGPAVWVVAKAHLALVKGDVGLGNVDNTSDANKPISTATQTALDLKQNTIAFTRTLPVVVNDYVELGTFTISTGGAHSFNLSAVVSDTGISISKFYTVVIKSAATGSTWYKLIPSASSGPWNGAQDFDIDIHVTGSVATLRARRSLGTTAGTLNVVITPLGKSVDVWAALTGTGSTTTPTVVYSTSPFRSEPLHASMFGFDPAASGAVNAAALAALNVACFVLGQRTAKVSPGSYTVTEDATIAPSTPQVYDVILVGDATINGMHHKRVHPEHAPPYPTFCDLDPVKHMPNFAAADDAVGVFLGDSTITPFADAMIATETIESALSRKLREENPDKNSITIHNRGVGSTNFGELATYPASYPVNITWDTGAADKPWLEYAEELLPDIVFICMGVNDRQNFNSTYIDTIVATIEGWTKPCDIVFCTNGVTSMKATTLTQADEEAIEGRDMPAGYIRNFTKKRGVYGLLDFNRQFNLAVHGIDVTNCRKVKVVDALSTTTPYAPTTYRSYEYGIKAQFGAGVTGAGPPVWLDGDGTEALQFLLGLAGTNTDPVDLRLDDDSGFVRVRVRAGSVTLYTVTTAYATPTGVQVTITVGINGPQVWVEIENGAGGTVTRIFDELVVRTGGRFHPRMKWSGSTTKACTVTLFKGEPMLYMPCLVADEVYGTITAPDDDGNGINHYSSQGFRSIIRPVLDACSFSVNAAPSSVPADNSITNAKIRDSAGLSVIGRSTDTTGDPADIVAASDNQVLRRSGTTVGFGSVATGGIANSAVTNAKLNDMVAGTVKANVTGGTTNPSDVDIDTAFKTALALVKADVGLGNVDNLSVLGKQTLYIPAGTMNKRASNGPADYTAELATNKIMVAGLAFDGTADEFAQFDVAFPQSWNGGTVTFRFIWYVPASGTGSVIFGLQGVARGDDEAVDAAFGTAQTVTDAWTANGRNMRSAESSAITIGGSPSKGDRVIFQIYRDADAAGDTLNAIDAILIGVELYFTTDAATDA